MVSAKDLVPAILFLVLYAGIFVFLTFLFFSKRIKKASRYMFIYVHVILRIAGQTMAIVFSCLTWNEPHTQTRVNVLIAFLVLAAEGYFSLVLCAYRFLIAWEQDYFGKSFLEPLIPAGTSFRQRMRMIQRSPITLVNWSLIGANAIIIAGSSMMSSKFTGGHDQDVSRGKVLRLVGTSIFLGIVQLFLLLCIRTFKSYNNNRDLKEYTRDGKITIFLIWGTWPLLTIRGVFGILSLVLPKYSYYNMSNYEDSGLTSSFLVGEYVLTTMPEFLSCSLLTLTYFWKKNDVKHVGLDQEKHYGK